MGFDEQREPAVGEPFDHPELPERFSPVELLRHDARGQELQLRVVARAGQGGVADVVAEVEVVVVDPHGLVEDGDPAETMAVARHEMQAPRDLVANPLDVDAARRQRQWSRLEEDQAAEVHVCGRVLEMEERAILRGNPFVEGVVHCGCARSTQLPSRL